MARKIAGKMRQELLLTFASQTVQVKHKQKERDGDVLDILPQPQPVSRFPISVALSGFSLTLVPVSLCQALFLLPVFSEGYA